MTQIQIPFQAGIFRDDTPLASGNKGGFIDGKNIRFVNGKVETKSGQELFSSTTLTGVARAARAWADNTRNKYVAFGTHLRLMAYDSDGTQYDITPVTSYSTQQSISFTTNSGSTSVTITGWTHGLVANQKFKLENATVEIGRAHV